MGKILVEKMQVKVSLVNQEFGTLEHRNRTLITP